LTEEQVTRAILARLADGNWHIIAYDFPQSGTGIMLHPNGGSAAKNKGGFVPDIIAVKGEICLFFENKNRFFADDFNKLFSLISDNQYTVDIEKLLRNFAVDNIYYGIGLPSEKWTKKAIEYAKMVDFVLGVAEFGGVEFLYNPFGLVV